MTKSHDKAKAKRRLSGKQAHRNKLWIWMPFLSGKQHLIEALGNSKLFGTSESVLKSYTEEHSINIDEMSNEEIANVLSLQKSQILLTDIMLDTLGGSMPVALIMLTKELFLKRLDALSAEEGIPIDDNRTMWLPQYEHWVAYSDAWRAMGKTVVVMNDDMDIRNILIDVLAFKLLAVECSKTMEKLLKGAQNE